MVVPLTVCTLFFTILSPLMASDDEFRLLQDLRTGYDPVERPVKNHSEAVTVKVRILLQQLVDVDEKNQLVSLVVWTQMSWVDYKMKWDPQEYGGITNIQLPPGTLWKPDVLLFNTADENFDASFPVNYAVQHTGVVLHAPPSMVKISCNIDLTFFPFDDQVCYMKFGSWTFTGTKVDLTIDNAGLTKQNQMDLLYYVPNGEWELLGTPAERVANEFNGEKYVELYFRMHLKRRTLYYGLNWIIPSVLISLSNVLGFTLPTECGEKLTLQITNLLSVLVFLGMVSEITPPTSESIPVIVAFFSASMLILGLSVITTVLIINIHFRSPKTHQMGTAMSTIFLEWLPWILLMNRPGRSFKKPKRLSMESNETDGSIISHESERDYPAGKRVVLVVNNDDNSCDERTKLRETVRRVDEANRSPLLMRPQLVSNDYCNYSTPLESTMKEIMNQLTIFREKLEEEEREEDQQADWKFMAMVLDRLFLFLFTGAYIMTVVFMLMATPRVFDSSPYL